MCGGPLCKDARWRVSMYLSQRYMLTADICGFMGKQG